MGEVDPLQPARARDLRGLVRAHGPVHARRLQRLPDAGCPCGTRAWRRALAALPAQPFRAVRRTTVDGRGRADEFHLLRRDGGLAAADRGCARGGPRGVRERGRCRSRARAGGAPVRRQWRTHRRALPGKPERLARRHRRPCFERRAGHHPDAAPGTRVPHGAEFLAPRGRRGGQRLDADVQERARLGGLTKSFSARTSPAGPPPLARKIGHSLAPGSRNGSFAR